ncbi:choline/ethanolamine kinase isoform X2 [Lepeophtheirus salmonis]|nr:choline/ethanolamine kinase-like isoform X2 [Lepeophtheirus salmonis]
MRTIQLLSPCTRESRAPLCVASSLTNVVKPVHNIGQNSFVTFSKCLSSVFAMNINQGDFKVKAWELCRDNLKGAWSDVSPDKIIISQISGGLSNLLYHCSLPEGIRSEGNEPSEVLLRIFGRNLKSNLNVDNVVFSLLSERGMGPHLYGIFPGGRLEEYIHSKSICQNQIRDPMYSLAIARKVARIHSMEMPINKDGTKIRQMMQSYLEQINDFNIDDVHDIKEKTIASEIMSHDLIGEVNWFWNMVQRFNSPIVFCHNDLTGGNILVKEEKVGSSDDQIVLIDYEYASYGYRAFDIANHFCEWMYDYSNKEYPHYYVVPEKFASKESQMKFFNEYLSKQSEIQSSEKIFHSKNQKKPHMSRNSYFERRVEALCNEVQHFILGAHLLWTLWSMVHSCDTEIKFGYMHYAQERFNQYLDLKSKLGFMK